MNFWILNGLLGISKNIFFLQYHQNQIIQIYCLECKHYNDVMFTCQTYVYKCFHVCFVSIKSGM